MYLIIIVLIYLYHLGIIYLKINFSLLIISVQINLWFSLSFTNVSFLFVGNTLTVPSSIVCFLIKEPRPVDLCLQI
jgi:hypothetical protein